MKRLIILVLSMVIIWAALLYAADTAVVVDRANDKSTTVTTNVDSFLPPTPKKSEVSASTYGTFDPVNYTLGPNDVIEVEIMRHPEFSGKYAVNLEGKIQVKFVGDMEVKGLTKAQLAEKLKTALTQYVVSPEINVSIIEYGSKVFYILGEVGAPGQYVMKAETISLRDAIHMAGLPTVNASMRRCRLITPSETGRPKVQSIDVYALLYGGDLKKNVMIKSGDIFYVPATLMAKIIRVISPATTVMGLSSSMPESVASGKTAVRTIEKGRQYY